MKKLLWAVLFGLVGVPSPVFCAGTSFTVSPIFAVDTRDTPGTTFLVSAEFFFDVRDVVTPDVTGFSSGFALDTRAVTPVAGHYSCIVGGMSPSDPVLGLLMVTVAKNRSFSATLNIDGVRYVLRGAFSDSGAYSGRIHRKNASDLFMELQLGIFGDASWVTGTVADGLTTFFAASSRAPFSTKSPVPSGVTGRYTVLFTPLYSPSSVLPGGTGYGTLVVAKSGKIKLTGVLGDGTAVSQGASLGADGTWPLFAVPYKKSGSILGVIRIGSPIDSHDVYGILQWRKNAVLRPRPNTLYGSGFSEELELVGSHYVSPAKGFPILNVPSAPQNLLFTVVAGNVFDLPSTRLLTLDSYNSVTAEGGEKFALKFSSPTGLFRGSFMDPSTKKQRGFRGAILQSDMVGGGFFFGNSQTGQVELQSSP